MANIGKEFEHQFKSCALSQDLCIIRLNDSATGFGIQNTTFAPHNICDFLIFKKPNLFALELKCTEYKSISIQRDPEDKNKKMIKLRQISDLSNMSLNDGVYAGFIFNFKDKESLEEDTYWMNIKDFNNFLVEKDKGSINKLDIVQYNGIRMEQRLRRTKYFYDIEGILNKIKET